jgi:hypothetical protein
MAASAAEAVESGRMPPFDAYETDECRPRFGWKNDPERVISLVVEAGLDLIARRDADVLVLGCMSLSFLGVAEHARERIGMPVINPALCALKTAEALVAQQLKPSRRTYGTPRKDVSPGRRPGKTNAVSSEAQPHPHSRRLEAEPR